MAEPLGIFTEKEKEQIYLEYRDKVYAYIRGKVADPHEAEDLQSCVFVKVFQGLGGFDRTRASLSTWIPISMFLGSIRKLIIAHPLCLSLSFIPDFY